LNARRSHQHYLSKPSRDEKSIDDAGIKVDGAAVDHIQLVTSLVEGRWVGLEEIFTMLDKILRQHSIDATVKLSYAALCHHKNPP
jgi:hypothetical protein